MLPSIQTIVICGAGTMGRGIAQVSAQSGFQTVVFDPDESVLSEARASIKKNFSMMADKNKISAVEEATFFKSIQFINEIDSCCGEVIIEAIVEKMEAKISLFSRLAAFNTPETIFATNTSSLSVSKIAEQVENASRVVGMHFFNPAPLMKLVEVVEAVQTSAKTVQTIFQLATLMGKTPVLCKDAPGFIVNRVARHYYLESLKCVEQGLADFETIDDILEATGFKMGPFRLMDLIGNDINLAVTNSLYEALDKPVRLKPSPIQEAKVKAGELGRKSGKGYYAY